MAELCSHQVNAANWFLGAAPEAVVASGGVYRFPEGNREVFDHVYATFDYPGGRTAMFSSIESNAFDDYYEMYMGTKGTLIMDREQDALLFEEGSAASRATAVETTPRTAGPGGAVVRDDERQHAAGVGAGGGARRRRAAERARARLAHHDSALLFGRPRRHAARVRRRQGVRFRARLHPRQRRDQAEGAADHMTPNALALASSLAAAGKAGHLTKQQFVYTTLRESIIRCELGPGTRLVIDDLARQFKVSIIPVREALRLLQSEGLVLSVAHVGATVAPISRASVVEVFTLLEGLEVVAARMAAERATPADFETLAGFVTEMDRALEAGSPLHWAEINTRFHLAISRLADMPILHDMMQRAVDYWDRVRRFYFRDVLIHRTRLAQAEHRAMLVQMQAHDIPALEETIRDHNRGALAAYMAHLSQTHDEGVVDQDKKRERPA